FSSTRRVESLAVAPSDRSRLYLAGGRSIMMSLDAGSNWERIYHDPNTETIITALAVDYANPKIIYAGTGQGTILQTRDGGETWFVPVRLSDFGAGGRVHKILTVDGDPSKLYAVVVDGLQIAGSVYISRDQGRSWSRNAALESVVRASKYGDFERDIRSGTLYYASLYGIFKSYNDGDTWEQLSLLTEAGSSMIYTLAIDPQKSDHVIYTTASNIVISENGGTEWKSVALPSFGNRIPRDMVVSRDVSADVLLGVGAQY
ncbi:MAG TPA: YCF48-related protein, partial [Patescibacteria group bacterium]|nr:YCF48-related protein [Patescibacteria group bacterium]